MRLGAKLGPILWQLPPNFKFDRGRLEEFFKILPRDTESAAALARKHNNKLKVRAWMKTDAARKLRHCIEIRNSTFLVPEFIELLRARDIALVCADAVEWPQLMDLTSNLFIAAYMARRNSMQAVMTRKLWTDGRRAWQAGRARRSRQTAIG